MLRHSWTAASARVTGRGLPSPVPGPCRSRGADRGLAIPLVLLALVVFFLFAGTLLFTSKGEYRLVRKTENRERARYIAESALALASALIYQNDFENRWYRKTQGRYGFTHVLEAPFAGGSYRVRAEDVIHELTDELRDDKEKRINELTYDRIDLFSRGSFGGESVVVYQSISLKPEEKVYGFTATVLDFGDGVTQKSYSNIHIR